MRYEDVLTSPYKCVERLARFLDVDGFDVMAAAASVHKRDGKCRPDLNFELTGEVPAQEVWQS